MPNVDATGYDSALSACSQSSQWQEVGMGGNGWRVGDAMVGCKMPQGSITWL